MTRRQPKTREQLLVAHREARRRRAEAALGSEDYRHAAEEIARIEIEIARVGREQSPPRV